MTVTVIMKELNIHQKCQCFKPLFYFNLSYLVSFPMALTQTLFNHVFKTLFSIFKMRWPNWITTFLFQNSGEIFFSSKIPITENVYHD